MKKFGDLNIQPDEELFAGKKIDMDDIIDKTIIVHDYKVGPSKYNDKPFCLTLQITFEDKKRIVFSGSKGLENTIRKATKEDFPFETTITREGKGLKFS